MKPFVDLAWLAPIWFLLISTVFLAKAILACANSAMIAVSATEDLEDDECLESDFDNFLTEEDL